MTEQGEKQDIVNQMVGAFSSLEKMAPKYCTTIQVSLLNNNNIVLTMIYNEPPTSAVLIERVVIDMDHANSLADILKTAVTQAKRQ